MVQRKLPMKFIPRLLAIVFLLVSPFAWAQKTTTIALESKGAGLLTVHATIGGRSGTFLFDSGGGIDVISPDFAASIGCHPWGQITGFRMTGQRLSNKHCDNFPVVLAGRTFHADLLTVFDLAALMPKDTPHLDGLISLDLFADQTFTLSYAGHFLRLLDKEALAKVSSTLHAMPIHIVRDAEGVALTVNLPVRTPDGTAWFEMDSGNTSGVVLVNKSLAPLFGLADDGKDSVVHLTLADGTAFSGEARVLDLILDGNLGMSFLAKHDVTIDLLHKTAWLSTPRP